MLKRLFILLLTSIGFINAHAQLQVGEPVIVEIIRPNNSAFRFGAFADMKDYGIQNIKQWHNRVIVYANTNYPQQLKARITKEYPKDQIVLFEKPFYNFNRKYCSSQTVAKRWDNIIMTANLVADPKMQQQYLDYHATQFQKWPQVSQGFCNAGFQQVLVFKSGRQLMLLISIPQGQSLDKLNPLTTKSNPRVNDWNNIMKKYQEGIEGTKKDELWVVFKDVGKSKFIE